MRMVNHCWWQGKPGQRCQLQTFLQLLRNWTLTRAQLWTTRNWIWNWIWEIYQQASFKKLNWKSFWYIGIVKIEMKRHQWLTNKRILEWRQAGLQFPVAHILSWSLLDTDWLRTAPSSAEKTLFSSSIFCSLLRGSF